MHHRRIGSGYIGAGGARGFSIVELMVAVAISLLLLTGVVAIFVSSKTSYETNERFSRIEENGRFALDRAASVSSPRSTNRGLKPCGPSVRTAPSPNPQLLTGRSRSTRPTARVARRASDAGAPAAPAPLHSRCRYA